MAGTSLGGRKAAATNKQRHDAKYAQYGGFYKYIGQKGGVANIAANGATFGFAADRQLAIEAGRKGGQKSRRRKPRGN